MPKAMSSTLPPHKEFKLLKTFCHPKDPMFGPVIYQLIIAGISVYLTMTGKWLL